MPDQVIPISDIAKAGVIMDTPSIALPPNALSDVKNVRFHDGAVRKMEGEDEFISSLADVVYVAYWQGVEGNYYVVVTYDPVDPTASVSLFGTNGVVIPNRGGTIPVDGDNPVWQHTIFNGGFHFILNNGTTTPIYLTDNQIGVTQLPNWDSYQSQERTVEVTFEGTEFDSKVNLGVRSFPMTEPANPTEEVLVTIIPISGEARRVGVFRQQTTISDIGTLAVSNSVLEFTPASSFPGDTVRATIRTIPDVSVTAGVVRAYGNLLVAGNLRETYSDASVPPKVLPGLIRTSDVAAPGQIPGNWNPFQIGVNTADEFVLASTGCVKDMVELQGVLYVYTDSSIHAVQQTGNPTLPFQISPVTDSWGADNTGSVVEVDGKHIVVGSSDVYVFAGHPGSISSISDSRVRAQDFFDDGRVVNIVRFQKYDELWFWSTSDPEMFVWNYRDNTWTRRDMTQPVSGTNGPGGPVFATPTGVYTVDTDSFTDVIDATYESYIERYRMALAPEFDTEQLLSVALMYSGTADLNLDFRTTNAPGGTLPVFEPTPTDVPMFDADKSWKTDIRVTGRFLNYRIGEMKSEPWNLTGMQFDIGKGGTR